MQFIIMLVLILVSALLQPDPKDAKRAGIGDFSAPTASQDRRIPVFWGRPWLEAPNLVWYGDLRSKRITKKVSSLFGSKKVTVGYKYYIGLHMVFGFGDSYTKLLKILVDDDEMWSGTLSGHTDGTISKPKIWGGDDKNGGMSGTFTFMSGDRTQGQNSYLKKKLGERVPAYRGVASISYNQGYHGNGTVLAPWKVQMERNPAYLQSGYADIDGEANAAEIQYEILTNSDWGMGLTADEIDVAALRACAATVSAEGAGMSLIWDGSRSIEDMLKEVDRHVDSVTYQDPQTLRWTMRLIRDDYDLATLPKVTPSNATLTRFSRPSGDELTNQVKVIYASNEFKGKAIPVQVQDPASFQNKDRQRVSSEMQYPGFTKESLAKWAATRDLRALSYPFARVELRVNRELWGLRPVDRIVLDWPPLGITNMPMLVMERSMGTLSDGTIMVVAVQDVFGVGEALYTESNSGGWTPIDRSPQPAQNYRIDFAPYWLLSIDPEVSSPEAAVPMLMVEAPTAGSLSFLLEYTDPALGGTFSEAPDSQPFTPTALLAHDWLEGAGTDTSGTLILHELNGTDEVPQASLDELRYQGLGLAVVEDEWIGIETVTSRSDGSYCVTKVHRGLLDTVPKRHLAGARVWFVGEQLARTPTEIYPFEAGTYKARILTEALGGVLDADVAPLASITTNATTTNARPLYAYPPRNLSLNDSTLPGPVSGTQLNLSWSHANKYSEDYIRLQSEGMSAPGDSHYVAWVYDHAGTQLAKSPAKIYGTTYTFSLGDLTGGQIPEAGYVQVAAANSKGESQRATLWFSRAVDFPNTQDDGPQSFLEEADPWAFVRMAD